MKRVTKYIIVVITIMILITISFLLIDTEKIKDNPSDNNTEKDTSTFMNIPIFNDSTEITDSLNDSFWESINLSSKLNLSCYVTNITISDIYNWYLIEIGFNWQIKSEGQFANNITLEIEKSYMKYQHQNRSKGLYIYISKKPESIDYNFENILCIAVGSWDEIYKSGISP